MKDEFFEELKVKAKGYFEGGDGHDFDHVERVCNMAVKISEGEDVDMDVVRAAALLHDVARSKESELDICHAEEGAKMAAEILREMGFPADKITKVVHAISVHRYSKGIKAESREAEILQDADRLDVLGAIILTRVFARCGKRNTAIYDPDIPVLEKYNGTDTTGINHLKEKSLEIVPESFKTPKAREIARGRYDYVKGFIDRFEKEWRGEL